MSVATDVLPTETAAPAEPLPHTRQILGRRWTADQLHALAAKDREVQQHVEHSAARTALAAHCLTVDMAGIRSMVSHVMGTIAGTYWMTAALHLAQLALDHPQFLSPIQYSLLLAPLEAAEAVPAAPEAAFAA